MTKETKIHKYHMAVTVKYSTNSNLCIQSHFGKNSELKCGLFFVYIFNPLDLFYFSSVVVYILFTIFKFNCKYIAVGDQLVKNMSIKRGLRTDFF